MRKRHIVGNVGQKTLCNIDMTYQEYIRHKRLNHLKYVTCKRCLMMYEAMEVREVAKEKAIPSVY